MPTPAVLDSVRALAMESPSEMGTQAYSVPTEINTREDALAAAGVYINGPSVTTPDKSVLLDRSTGSNMRFTDAVAQHVLSNVVGAAYNGSQPHSGLPDASHLDDFGPDVGFASGAFYSRSFSGPLIASETWWTSSNQSQKIYAKTYSYTGPLVTTITRTVYNASGAVLRTITDTLTYSGAVMQQITRTWS